MVTTDQQHKSQCGEVSDKERPYNTLVPHTVTIAKPSEPQNYNMEPHVAHWLWNAHPCYKPVVMKNNARWTANLSSENVFITHHT